MTEENKSKEQESEEVLRKHVDIDLDEEDRKAQEEEEAEKLVITEENWDQYFFDIRQHNPKPGQIIAKYSAIGEFVDGPEKRQVMDLLQNTSKMEATAQVMRKLLFASEKAAIRVPREMAEDLLDGMSRQQVAEKDYSFLIEMFFYTEKRYVPKQDSHWTIISLLNPDEYLGKTKSDEDKKSG